MTKLHEIEVIISFLYVSLNKKIIKFWEPGFLYLTLYIYNECPFLIKYHLYLKHHSISSKRFFLIFFNEKHRHDSCLNLNGLYSDTDPFFRPFFQAKRSGSTRVVTKNSLAILFLLKIVSIPRYDHFRFYRVIMRLWCDNIIKALSQIKLEQFRFIRGYFFYTKIFAFFTSISLHQKFSFHQFFNFYLTQKVTG